MYLLSAAPFSCAHMAISHCVRKVREVKPRERTGGGLLVAIEEALEDFFGRHMYPHPQYGTYGGPNFELLVAARSDVDKTLGLYATTETAITEVRDYECVGAGAFLANYLLPTLFRHKGMGVKDTANVAIHVLRETKSYVDSCGGGSEFVALDNNGGISAVTSFDIDTGETLSEGFVSAVRRIYVVAADLDSTPEQLKEEFDMALLVINAYRAGIVQKKREHDALFGMLEIRTNEGDVKL